VALPPVCKVPGFYTALRSPNIKLTRFWVQQPGLTKRNLAPCKFAPTINCNLPLLSHSYLLASSAAVSGAWPQALQHWNKDIKLSGRTEPARQLDMATIHGTPSKGRYRLALYLHGQARLLPALAAARASFAFQAHYFGSRVK